MAAIGGEPWKVPRNFLRRKGGFREGSSLFSFAEEGTPAKDMAEFGLIEKNLSCNVCFDIIRTGHSGLGCLHLLCMGSPNYPNYFPTEPIL